MEFRTVADSLGINREYRAVSHVRNKGLTSHGDQCLGRTLKDPVRPVVVGRKVFSIDFFLRVGTKRMQPIKYEREREKIDMRLLLEALDSLHTFLPFSTFSRCVFLTNRSSIYSGVAGK